MVKELKGLENFIPRNQQDRITLVTLEMLSEINENIKKLIENTKPVVIEKPKRVKKEVK